MSPQFRVVAREANYWWRNNAVAGAVLNKMMLLFIVVPVALVFKKFYVTSFIVFGFMVPYGFLLHALATRAVLKYLQAHPETLEALESAGVVETRG